jgi:hypothetical protein
VTVSKLRTVSWVLLTIVGVLALLLAALSASLAYRGAFAVGGVAIGDVAMGREAVLAGLRGARGTAAAWACGFATLFLFVVLGPYRRGDVASWWGILVSTLVLLLVAAARVPLIGIRAGVETPLALLVAVVVALLLDVRRLTARA